MWRDAPSTVLSVCHLSTILHHVGVYLVNFVLEMINSLLDLELWSTLWDWTPSDVFGCWKSFNNCFLSLQRNLHHTLLVLWLLYEVLKFAHLYFLLINYTIISCIRHRSWIIVYYLPISVTVFLISVSFCDKSLKILFTLPSIITSSFLVNSSSSSLISIKYDNIGFINNNLLVVSYKYCFWFRSLSKILAFYSLINASSDKFWIAICLFSLTLMSSWKIYWIYLNYSFVFL